MSTENTEVKIKRGRGRPKGSKNKPKTASKPETKITTVLQKEEVVKTETPVVSKPAVTPVTSKVKVVVTEDEPTVESVE